MRTSEKVSLLVNYFREAAPADAAWALYLLSEQRTQRTVKMATLRDWAAESAGLPLWLVEECNKAVGDLAETLALILPEPTTPTTHTLSRVIEDWLLPLRGAPESDQRDRIRAAWNQLEASQRLLWHKLVTGSFRAGVSRALLARALATVAGLEVAIVAHRLMGDWTPTPAEFYRLLSVRQDGKEPARPYPFFLASPLDSPLAELGSVSEWRVEWKWDGIRVQILRRSGECVIWSRGEEVVTSGFPEIRSAAAGLPEGVVLDGELLPWRGDHPLPFVQLQRRLNRPHVSARLQSEVPVVFMAYDLLERNGEDFREQPLDQRCAALAVMIEEAAQNASTRSTRAENWLQGELFSDSASSKSPSVAFALRVSTPLDAPGWEAVQALRETARTHGTEGLMLKSRTSPYATGRVRGDWWKWRVSPLTCDVVLVGAQPGQGRRTTLFTDYTLAVWRGCELVTVAKADSGLTDAEIEEVDAFVRANTLGKFGPLRSVKAELVFELVFEGIATSSRHKSGIALRFPRIARWRRDKQAAEADTMAALQRLMG